MKKGTHAPASMSKPVEGKKDTSKPAGGKQMQPFAGAAKPGKKVTKG